MSYLDSFCEHYKKFLSTSKLSTLAEQEKLLSRMIDDDIVFNSLLIDEVIILYDLVRDECVRRVVMMADRGAGLPL